MHLFVERGMWDGISMVSKRYFKANNPQVPDYDLSKPKKYIIYLECRALQKLAVLSEAGHETETENVLYLEGGRKQYQKSKGRKKTALSRNK